MQKSRCKFENTYCPEIISSVAVTYHGYLSYAKDKEGKGLQSTFSSSSGLPFSATLGHTCLLAGCIIHMEVSEVICLTQFDTHLPVFFIFWGKICVSGIEIAQNDKPCIMNQ